MSVVFTYDIPKKDIIITLEGLKDASAVVALTPSQLDKIRASKLLLLDRRDEQDREKKRRESNRHG